MKHECICHLLSAETIDNLKKQFGKPEIRHGDYGLDYDGDLCVIFSKEHYGKNEYIVFWDDGSFGDWTKESVNSWDYTVLGNIFSDIKAKKEKGEDLDRTNIDGFVLEIRSDRIVVGGRRFLIKQAEEFYQKLGQIIATAKRKDC